MKIALRNFTFVLRRASIRFKPLIDCEPMEGDAPGSWFHGCWFNWLGLRGFFCWLKVDE
jgi:hypothetical protein